MMTRKIHRELFKKVLTKPYDKGDYPLEPLLAKKGGLMGDFLYPPCIECLTIT